MTVQKMSFYAVIPSHILTSQSLSSNEKILYGIVSSLTNKKGYCFASNSNLTNYFEKDGHKPHAKTISKWVNNLVRLGYLKNEVVRTEGGKVTERKLWICDTVIVKDNTEEHEKKVNPKKDKYNGNKELIHKVISYLNDVTGKSFRNTTDSYVKVISARISDGYKYEDFKKVVESKAMDEWYLKNPHYFAPTTIFAKSKFDKNLQGWTQEKRDAVYTVTNFEDEELELSEEEF